MTITTIRMARALGAGLMLCFLATGFTQAAEQRFDTPEDAVAALLGLIGKRDAAGIERVFGEGSAELFSSGDEADDHADFQRVKAMIEESVEFADHDDTTKVALFGADAWPWPIPLVSENGKWRFDTASGREELLNRRIGQNELQTLASLREIVAAQREYASVGHDGRQSAYAQKFMSSPGKRDGLFWPSAEGEGLSPLGDLLAESGLHTAQGGEPQPYSGYYYRILTAQGSNAPGGARSYLDPAGDMRSGFAVLAWPAKYGNSGVMTFMMSQRGIIYESDLGENTAEAVTTIKAFDPGPNWTPSRGLAHIMVD